MPWFGSHPNRIFPELPNEDLPSDLLEKHFCEMGVGLKQVTDPQCRYSIRIQDTLLISRNEGDPVNSWYWMGLDEGWQPWDDSDEANK
jgi:hypothetical protein